MRVHLINRNIQGFCITRFSFFCGFVSSVLRKNDFHQKVNRKSNFEDINNYNKQLTTR